jgi:hypothetical protein
MIIQEKVIHGSTRLVSVPRPNFSGGPIVLLCLAFFAFLAIYRQFPPNVVAASAPPTEFSSSRARKHVEQIARQPHPIGSSEHAAVRDYILHELSVLGLDPGVQKTTAINRRPGLPRLGGTVENVFARVAGTSGGKAVLLACHYDSVPTGPGASDDGSAVAALLETARALKAGPPLKNDVLLLFTDGEEVGLLGAGAFVAEHPWARQVAVALNFEARGSRGPALMFETSADNFYLVKEFAQSAPHPRTNSLFYEIYRLLPNDTDFTVFRQAGIPGLNFAFIDPVTNYHTQLDSIENMDERSLQHQGSYALALARRFGNAAELPAVRGNAIYFDLLGAFVIYYPVSWVVPVTVLLTLMFATVVILGIRKRSLSIGGIGLGALASFLALAGSFLLVSLVWWLVRRLHSQYDLMPAGDTYNSRLYLIAFAALTLAFTSALYVFASKRVSVQNLWAGALIWWLVLLVLAALFLPGSSYLFTWPLFFSLPALGVTLLAKGDTLSSVRAQAGPLLAAVTGVVLFSPLIYLVFIGLTVSMSGVVMVMLALLLTLFLPQNDLMKGKKRWLLPFASLIVCAGFLLAGSLSAGFSRTQPQQDHLLYGSNADTQSAVWASSNARPDAWTAQFFSQGPQRSSLPDLFPFSSRQFLTAQAPFIALPAPSIEVLSDNADNGVRTLSLRLTSPRQAPVISLGVAADMPIECTSINGKPVKNDSDKGQETNGNEWGIRYYSPPSEGVQLTFETASKQPLVFKVVDQSYGLPSILNFKPRPDNSIPAPGPTSESTLVARSFTF